MTPELSTIFVYGTLLRGESNHRFLARASFVAEARSEPWFELVDLGHFPALIAGGQTAVHGELYRVDDETLSRLDRLEGHPHFYTRTNIALADGVHAQTYLLPAHQAAGARRITSGSWRTRDDGSAAAAPGVRRP